jgi:hypothetical protein
LSASTGISYNSTTGAISCTITQYTDAAARAAVSFTAGSGAYNSTTGVFTIPTNTNQLTNGAGFVTSSGVTSLTAGSYLTGGTITSTGTIAVDATNLNTASKVVARDASGNFSAGTITAALSGNATTATTLQTARAIQGVNFDGSAAITVVTAGTGISVSGTAVTNTGVLSVSGTAPISASTTSGATTVSISAASTTAAGSMSAADKSKLDGIASGATANTGTVTSIATSNGISGGTITTTGTLSLSGSYTGTWAVTGAITATGEVTAYFSDRNLKKDIVEIQDPIAKVMSIRGVTFRPNETALALGVTDKDEVGVIAQEVEAVLPQLVAPSAFKGYKTVKYDKLTALLVEAVKAQQLQIDSLRAEIAKLGGSATTEL